MVVGSPEHKRKFLNQSLIIEDVQIRTQLSQFLKILKQRNMALKQGATQELDALTHQFIHIGCEIQEKRKRFFENHAAIISNLSHQVSDGEFTIRLEYRPSWKSTEYEEIDISMKSNRERERITKITHSGPHRDSYRLYLNEVPISLGGSMGQQRIAALLLRMMQAQIYIQAHGMEVVYLFDDVLLELDEEKKRNFIARLPKYTQAFFTFLPSESLSYYNDTDSIVYTIEGGRGAKNTENR